MLVEFDKLKRVSLTSPRPSSYTFADCLITFYPLQDFQEHQNEIHAKLIAIMGDRLAIHITTFKVRLQPELLIPQDDPNLNGLLIKYKNRRRSTGKPRLPRLESPATTSSSSLRRLLSCTRSCRSICPNRRSR